MHCKNWFKRTCKQNVTQPFDFFTNDWDTEKKSNVELLFGCFCCNRFSLLRAKVVFPEAWRLTILMIAIGFGNIAKLVLYHRLFKYVYFRGTLGHFFKNGEILGSFWLRFCSLKSPSSIENPLIMNIWWLLVIQIVFVSNWNINLDSGRRQNEFLRKSSKIFAIFCRIWSFLKLDLIYGKI